MATRGGRADELALFYPLAGQGPAAGGGPGVVPSVRLKAYRRGQQDVEYLVLWSVHRGLPRWAVGRQVRDLLRLAGSRQATETGGAEDAGRIDYASLRPQQLWSLRVRLGEALSAAHSARRIQAGRVVAVGRLPRHSPRDRQLTVPTNEGFRFREN